MFVPEEHGQQFDGVLVDLFQLSIVVNHDLLYLRHDLRPMKTDQIEILFLYQPLLFLYIFGLELSIPIGFTQINPEIFVNIIFLSFLFEIVF